VPCDAQAFLIQVLAVFAYVLRDNRFVLATIWVYGSEGWGFKSSRARHSRADELMISPGARQLAAS
jgi:hypothetical protein